MEKLSKPNPDNLEQQKYLKKIHRWINTTFIINLLITIITLCPLIINYILRIANPESDDLFSTAALWLSFNILAIPVNIIVSFFSFLTLREWRAQKLSNQNYELAYITIALGLVPLFCLVTMFCIVGI